MPNVCRRLGFKAHGIPVGHWKREEPEGKSPRNQKTAKRGEMKAAMLGLAEKVGLAFVSGVAAAAGGYAVSSLVRRPSAEIVPFRKTV